MNMEEFTRHYSHSDLCGSANIDTNNSHSKSTDPHISDVLSTDDVEEYDKSMDCEKKLDSSSLKSVDSGITELTLEGSHTEIKEKESHVDVSSVKSVGGEVDDSIKASLSLLLLQNRPKNSNSHITDVDIGTLESMDNSSGILHVWFLLIDGLAGSVASCPKAYQPDTLDMLFQILRSTADVPGLYTWKMD